MGLGSVAEPGGGLAIAASGAVGRTGGRGALASAAARRVAGLFRAVSFLSSADWNELRLAADKRNPSRSERACLEAASRKLTAAEYELTGAVPTTKEAIRAKLEQLAHFGDPELVNAAITSILRSAHRRTAKV